MQPPAARRAMLTPVAVLAATLATMGGMAMGAGEEGAGANLGGLTWRVDAARPQDFWLEPEGGPQKNGALVGRAFPHKSGRWASRPMLVEPGRAYLFSALVKAELANADGWLEMVFRDAAGKELLRRRSRWIFWRHNWARYEVAGVAPDGAATVTLGFAVRGTRDDAGGQALMADCSFRPTVSLWARIAAEGHVVAPGRRPKLTVVLSGAPADAALRVSWKLLDFDRAQVQGGAGQRDGLHVGEHQFILPILGPGYYTLEVKAEGRGLAPARREVSLAVVPELPAPPPADSPICLDAGMSWSYPPQQSRDRLELACKLVERAGIRQLRDRLWWGEAERQEGKIDWGRYKLAADAQHRHGITVYQIFHDCPAWAQVPIETGRPDSHYPPRDPIYVYRMVNRLVRDLGDRIRYFEVWNEPNIGFFMGHPWDYAALLKAAYLGAKDADPSFGVLIGSAAGTPGEFYEQVYENGAGRYFDIYNQHSYGTPEALFDFLARVRRQLARFGLDNKPLWITEMGMRAHPDPEGRFWPVEREQVSYLVRAYACALANGVRRFHYFYLAEFFEGSVSLWGILRRDLTPKPAYVALCNLVRQLGEARCLGWRKLSDGGYVVAFRRTADEAVAVVWDAEGGTVSLPARGPVVDAVGRVLQPAQTALGLSVKLSRMPVYVRGIPLAAVESMDLRPPVPALEYKGQPDKHLRAKRVFLQAEVNPDQPRPAGHKMREQKLAVAIKPGQQVTVAAWVNNYSNDPATVRVRCEAGEGLGVAGENEVELAAEPWKRARHDFIIVARQVAQGQTLRARLVMTGDYRDVAAVRFRAAETDIQPTERAVLFGPETELGAWSNNHSPAVEVQMARDDDVKYHDAPALRIAATIQGQGDAWVFPRLRVPSGVDLSKYRAVEVWTYVAAGSEAAPGLSLQLVESGGGTWLIAGLRMLSTPGWQRSIALLSHAKPTSWGPDPDGKLDLSKVRQIMLGWGGYKGRPGEQVAFWVGSVAAVSW